MPIQKPVIYRLLERISAAALILIAVPAGVVAGLFAFFGVARVTSATWLLTIAGALVLVIVTGGLSLLASTLLPRRGKWSRTWVPIGITAGAVAFVSLAFIALVFEPMDVEYVPLEPTKHTQYWELHTSSRIAYMVTEAVVAIAAPPVIMLHGGPGAPGPMVPGRTEQRLAKAGFDVYAYHQVGAGLSSRLRDAGYSVERHVADLEAIRRSIGAKQVILVGGSWGATLAAHYMATHPERVAQAVLTAPGPLWSRAWSDWEYDAGVEADIIAEAVTPRFAFAYYLMQTNPAAAQNLVPDKEISGFMQPLIGQIMAGDMSPCGSERTPEDSNRDPVIPKGLGFYANMVTTASVRETADPRPILRTLETPVLVVRGECDRIPKEVVQEYLAVLPNSQLFVIEGVAHDAARAEVYPRVVERFLLGEELATTTTAHR